MPLTSKGDSPLPPKTIHEAVYKVAPFTQAVRDACFESFADAIWHCQILILPYVWIFHLVTRVGPRCLVFVVLAFGLSLVLLFLLNPKAAANMVGSALAWGPSIFVRAFEEFLEELWSVIWRKTVTDNLPAFMATDTHTGDNSPAAGPHSSGGTLTLFIGLLGGILGTRRFNHPAPNGAH